MLHQIDSLSLYIGDKDAALNPSMFFDCIVNVTRELPSSGTSVQLYWRIGVLDIDAPSELAIMVKGCQELCPLVQRVLDYGGKVLVHCSQGIQRSATFVTAFLMMSRHLTANDAIRQLRELYPRAFSDTGRARFRKALVHLQLYGFLQIS